MAFAATGSIRCGSLASVVFDVAVNPLVLMAHCGTSHPLTSAAVRTWPTAHVGGANDNLLECQRVLVELAESAVVQGEERPVFAGVLQREPGFPGPRRPVPRVADAADEHVLGDRAGTGGAAPYLDAGAHFEAEGQRPQPCGVAERADDELIEAGLVRLADVQHPLRPLQDGGIILQHQVSARVGAG